MNRVHKENKIRVSKEEEILFFFGIGLAEKSPPDKDGIFGQAKNPTPTLFPLGYKISSL